MANEIDERIVEAKFDGAQFEKGVDKTLKKLNELKESLNLKDTGKSVAQFAKEANEGIEKTTSLLERLQNRVTTFTGMIKQQLLGGLASEVSGLFLNLEQSARRLINSLGSQQMQAGMAKYTDILNSVRTLVVSGESQDDAYRAIDRLQTYSDQTNASLEAMVGLMSKLKTSGSSLEDARKSVEGLSNAAASMGVNMANWPAIYNNWAQAYGRGKMLYQDWQTMETFNMVGKEFEQVILDAAVAEGTLTKEVSKNGEVFYQTSNKVDKTIKKSKKVSQDKALKELMSYGFMTKKVMDRITQSYYFEPISEEDLDAFEERIKEFGYESLSPIEQLQYKSFKAGQEARSFADALNTLKNAISTGWKDTFEIIFGKLDKATEFFTWLSDNNLVTAIRAIGDFRNEVLKAWGNDWLEGGLFHAKNEDLGILGTGRDMLLDSLYNIDEMIGVVHEGLVDLLPKSDMLRPWDKENFTFAQDLGYKLAMMTKNFRAATNAMLDFFTVEEKTDKGTKRVLRDEYKDTLASFGKILGSVTKGAGALLGVITKIAGVASKGLARLTTTFQPIFNAIGDGLNKVFAPIVDLNSDKGFFDNLTNAIDNLLIVIKPAVDKLAPFISFLGDIGGFFVDMALDTVSTNIELFADALGLIIELFGGTSAQKLNDGVGVLESWQNDLKSFSDTCREGLGAIKEFFTTLFNDIRQIFGIGEETDGKSGGFFEGIQEFFSTNTFVQKVKAWVDQAVVDVSNWINALPENISKATSGLRNSAKKVWNKVDEFLFGKKVQVARQGSDGLWHIVTERYKSGFSLWLSQLPKKVGDWFSKLPEKFRAIWDTVDEFLFGKKVTTTKKTPDGGTEEVTTRVKEGFSLWLDKTIADVKGWFANIPQTISNLWKDIINFFFGEEVTVPEVDENGVATEKTTRVKTGFSLWLADTVEAIRNWFTNDAPAMLEQLWKDVIAFFFGEEVTVTDVDENGIATEKTTRVQTGFSKWLADTVATIKKWVTTDIPDAISTVWNDILDAIFGKTKVEEGAEQAAEEQKNSIVQQADEALKSIGVDIGALFTNLPTYIASGITGGVDLLKNLFEHVQNFFKNKNEARTEGQEVTDLVNKDAEAIAKEIEKGAEVESPLLSALLSIGTSLRGLVTETIPGMLSEAFTYVSGESAGWWESIKTIFNLPGFDWDSVKQGAADIGTRIAGYIREIPDALRAATESIGSLFKSPFEKTQEEITKAFTGPDGKIINEQAYQQAMEHARKSLSGTPKEVGLFDGIKEIGKSIGDAFVDLGPDILNGINKAFTWIGDQITNFTQKLNDRDKSQGFFEWIGNMVGSGDEQESAIASSIKSLGETIKNIIVNVIPGFIGAAFAELRVGIPIALQSLFGGNQNTETIKEGAEEAGENVVNAFESGFQDSLKELGGENDGFNLGSIINAMFGISRANAEEFDYNPDAAAKGLEQYNEVLETSNDQLVKTESVYINRLKTIDELRKELDKANETLAFAEPDEREKIDAAYAEQQRLEKLITVLDNMEGELVDASIIDPSLYNKTKDAGEKIQESASGFLGSIQQIVSLVSSDGGKIIGTLALLTVIIHEAKEIFSVTDEIEGIGWTAKWEAIKIAVLGIVAMLGWVSYLSSQADANTESGRLNTTMKTLDRLTGFIERIGNIAITLGKIQIGGSLLEALGSFFDYRAAKSTAKAATEAGNIFANLGTSLLTKVSELGVLAIGSDVVAGGFETVAESLGAVFSDIGLGIDNMMTFLDPAIEKMASMSTNIKTAISMVDDLIVLIGKLNDMSGAVEFASDLNKDIGGVSSGKPLDYDYFSKGSFVVTELQSTLGFISALGATMSSLGKGINEFLSIEDSSTKINGLIEFLQTDDFKTLLSTLFETVAEILPTNLGDISNLTYTSLGLDMLSNALSIFADGLSGLDQGSVDTLSKTLDLFDKLTAIVVESPEANQSVLQKVFSGDTSFSHFGQEIASFGGSIRSFFNNVKHMTGVDEASINNTEHRIDLIVKIAQGLAEAIPNLVSIGNGSSIEVLGEKLETFGTHIGSFITAVSSNIGDDITFDRVELIKEAVTGVATLMSGLGDMMGHFTNAEEIPDFFNYFFKGLAENMVGDNNLFALGLTRGGDLDSGLAEGIKGGKAIAATEEVVANITSVLDVLKSLGITDEDFSPTITLVVDTTNLDEAKDKIDLLQNGGVFNFRTGGLNDFANSANPNAYSGSPDYTGILNSIQSSLSNLGGPTTVKTSLSGVRVQMDTGALVGALIGEIDMRLGRLGSYAEREGG